MADDRGMSTETMIAKLDEGVRRAERGEVPIFSERYAMREARHRLAALAEIVRAVIVDNGPLVQDSEYLTFTCGLCGASPEKSSDWRRESVIHTPNCPVTKARALLEIHLSEQAD